MTFAGKGSNSVARGGSGGGVDSGGGYEGTNLEVW